MEIEGRKEELFLTAWRNSDFYNYVRDIIKKEMETSYLKEAMAKRYDDGTPMSNEEIGEQARIEYQISLRFQNILDTLE